MPTPVKESIIDQVSLLFPGAGRMVICTLDTGEEPSETMGDWSQVPEFLDPFFCPLSFLSLPNSREGEVGSGCLLVPLCSDARQLGEIFISLWFAFLQWHRFPEDGL